VAKSDKANDALLLELGDVKRLLILQLLVQGVSQAQIALALGVNQSTISRLVPGVSFAKKG
jgi:DNA-binding NarL/FixJ family response regulator